MYSSVQIVGPDNPLFDAAWAFTQAQYHQRFNCQLTVPFPHIALLTGKDGAIGAVAGLRSGASPLFLEQYLDAPVDTILEKQTDRTSIVELGAFAAINRDTALEFMLKLPQRLLDQGFEVLVCTANRPVRKCLQKLGIRSQLLADADRSRIENDGTVWGSYYDGDPVVLAGDIRSSIKTMQSIYGVAA